MAAATGGSLRRAIRRFTLGSGPLKRSSDRVQMVARWVLLLVVLLAPVPATVAMGVTTSRLERLAAAQAAERTPVEARLLTDAPAVGAPVTSTLVPVQAGWQDPGGLARRATVFTAPGTPAGTPRQVWLDRDGARVGAPMSRSAVAVTAMTSGAFALLAPPLVGWALYAVLVLTLDARRDRGWADEWAAMEHRLT